MGWGVCIVIWTMTTSWNILFFGYVDHNMVTHSAILAICAVGKSRFGGYPTLKVNNAELEDLFVLSLFNSFPLDAYTRQWTGSALVQVMAWRQFITWINAELSSIGLLGTIFNEIWIGILSYSFTKIVLKMSSARMSAILSRGRWVKEHSNDRRNKARRLSLNSVGSTPTLVTETNCFYIRHNKNPITISRTHLILLPPMCNVSSLAQKWHHGNRPIVHLIAEANLINPLVKLQLISWLLLNNNSNKVIDIPFRQQLTCSPKYLVFATHLPSKCNSTLRIAWEFVGGLYFSWIYYFTKYTHTQRWGKMQVLHCFYPFPHIHSGNWWT